MPPPNPRSIAEISPRARSCSISPRRQRNIRHTPRPASRPRHACPAVAGSLPPSPSPTPTSASRPAVAGGAKIVEIYSSDFLSRLSTIDTTPLMAQARVIFWVAAHRPPRSSRAPSPEAQTRPPHLLPETHPHPLLSAVATDNAPLPYIVIVGSADIYVEVHRSPLIGKTAARAARAPTWPPAVGPTYLVARVGDDANGRLLEDALAKAGGVAPTASRARPMRHRNMS